MNDIHNRLAAIEKQNRILRIAVTALGCVMLTVVAAAAATKPAEIWDKIKARHIELVDQDGNPLAVIEEVGGKGRITTRKSSGEKLIELGTDASGIGSLAIFGSKGTAIVSAGHDAAHGNGVFARNGDEKVCAGLVASPHGYGTIVVCNHDEQIVGWLVGNEKGGSLFLNDAKGGPLVMATAAAESGQGTMVLKSHEGKVLGRLPQ